MILVFLVWQLVAWLIFRCKKQPKQPGAAEGDLFAMGQSGSAIGPTRRFHEPGHIVCRAVAPPNSVRLIHHLEVWLALRFQSESLPKRPYPSRRAQRGAILPEALIRRIRWPIYRVL